MALTCTLIQTDNRKNYVVGEMAVLSPFGSWSNLYYSQRDGPLEVLYHAHL